MGEPYNHWQGDYQGRPLWDWLYSHKSIFTCVFKGCKDGTPSRIGQFFNWHFPVSYTHFYCNLCVCSPKERVGIKALSPSGNEQIWLFLLIGKENPPSVGQVRSEYFLMKVSRSTAFLASVQPGARKVCRIVSNALSGFFFFTEYRCIEI